MIIVGLHGFGVTSEGCLMCQNLHKWFGDEHTVITPSYDYTDPEKALETISDAVIEVMVGGTEDSRIVFAGFSLGAFWAEFFGSGLYNTRIMMINPALDPSTQLRGYIGTFNDFITGEKKTLTANAVQQYDTVGSPDSHVYCNNYDNQILVFMAQDDEVVDAKHINERFGDMVVPVTGGHRLIDTFDSLKDRMVSFVTE